MTKDFQVRTSAFLLALITVTAAAFAWINYQKEREFPTPTDGVWWVERGDKLRAERVDPQGPGERAGIKQGDVLVEVNEQAVSNSASLNRRIYSAGIYTKANYVLIRDSVRVEVPVILIPADKSLNAGLRFIALIYLGIGLYVLLRRWGAPKSTHFYFFCLVSFVFYAFKYTGKLNLFDWSIYWANVGAWLLQPALFLHFALTFPEGQELVRGRKRWSLLLVYLPAAVLLGVQIAAFELWEASALLLWNLDRLHWFYLGAYFILAAVLLWVNYRRADTPLLRQQMKWVTRGTIIAIAPFTFFYLIPYLAGTLPTTAMKVSVLSLVFLPLTFGYAIVRYRLMDVDIIFKRGMAYTLATAAVMGLYFGAVALIAELVHTRMPAAGTTGLVLAIVITALLFDPLKRWIQERFDQVFYRKRYDYRKTLIAFGRELSAETDLSKMLASVVDRLSRTLMVDRIGVFLATSNPDQPYMLAKSFGISYSGDLDLSFLNATRPEFETGHLFFDNTRAALRETWSAQATIAKLDLNYYLPCSIQQRTIAVLGLGKTADGDFLSSEDVELLETVAGYLGIAIQNALLYASLEQKVAEYERLKDFNENIVESINVGVLAVDLNDRVESWNSQMEVMYATPRSEAIGRTLSEIFPGPFLHEWSRLREQQGIHNLYKFRLGTPMGDQRVTNIAIAPLVTKRFNVIGRLVIVDDITDRLELESQLSQAEKMSSIGLLAAGVAHEVNTPLAVISSYTQMLQKQLRDDEQKSGILEKITRQTFRASEIVNNLLNFSRTSGAEFSEVNLNKIITDTLALLEHQFKTARIRVQDELYPELPAIYGNPGKLQQVFLNLFLNAKDAMAGGGTLTVTTSNGSGVFVAISDTGTGIAQEHLARIYDPFFTTKNGGRTGERRGTGLGLSVTYGIIQEHAGKITVESQPGQGTRFMVEFPLMRKAVNV